MRKGIELSRKVLDAGYAPFVPWLDYQFSLVSPGMTIDKYYRYSMTWLEVSDAMILVPGWENSRGVQNEILRAVELEIPVCNTIEELGECLKLIKS
jgi:hypothetical protein